MPNPFITRYQQLLCKIQTVPGTFETLAAADGKIRIIEGEPPSYNAPKNKRDIARASLTQTGMLASTKALAFALRSEINTPDDITQIFEYDALLRSSGHSVAQYRRIPIGAITGGPIARGATLTGGTSAGTGLVLIPAVTGDTHIYYLVVSGTLASAEVLSFTGGATATTSAVSAVWGRMVRPAKPTEVASLEFQEDGYAWSARDFMSNMSMEFENSKAGFINFAGMGVKNAMGKKTMTSGIAFDVEDPPIFQNAFVKLGSWIPVVAKVSFEEGAKVVARGNANAAGNTGLEGFRISGEREAKFKVTLEHVDEDTKDFFADHDASTKYPFQMRCGTVAGKTFWAFGDQVEINSPSTSKGEGIRQVELELVCTHTTDNREYEFLSA